jgi:hypothetical protein
MTTPIQASFVDHRLDPIMKISLHLVAQRIDAASPDDYDALGSAVFVTPILALTAWHVIKDYADRFGVAGDQRGHVFDIEEYLRKHGIDGPAGNVFEGHFHLRAIQVLCKGPDDPQPVVVIYNVEQMVTPEWSTDLALLRLTRASPLPEDYDARLITFQLAPPKVGAVATAFGYYGGKVTAHEGPATTIVRQPATSIGEITEVHPVGRANKKWPHFVTNAHYEGGMSGCPVFVNGSVCGIVTSSVSFDDGAPAYSTVSLLWPIMGMKMNFRIVPGDEAPKPYTIYELAKRGLLPFVGLERVTLIEENDRRQMGFDGSGT